MSPRIFLSCFLIISLSSIVSSNTYDKTYDNLLQNDIMAAFSYALLDIKPDSYYHNITENREISNVQTNFKIEENEELHGTTERKMKSSRQKRQLFTLQGDRPKIKIDLRPLSTSLFEFYEGNSIGVFLGVGASGYVDDLLHLKQRRSKDDNMFLALEEIVSMMGVDGAACVHRLLCDIGSTPVLKDHGLFAEMADITIRYILKEEYQDINSIDGSSATMRYMDAVTAGRKGGDCAATYSQCPISLINMIEMVRSSNI